MSQRNRATLMNVLTYKLSQQNLAPLASLDDERRLKMIEGKGEN